MNTILKIGSESYRGELAQSKNMFDTFQTNKMYLHFLKAGYPVFGLYGITKKSLCECGNPTCKALFKHPHFPNWQNTPLYTDRQITVLENEGYFDTGYGVLVNGLLVIDVDERNGGEESYQQLIKIIPEILDTGLTVKTGSGGKSKHLYFKLSSDTKLMSHLKEYPGIDFKSSGYVVGPGSLHKSGMLYEILDGTPYDILEVPSTLLELLQHQDKKNQSIDDNSKEYSNEQIDELLFYITPDCSFEEWIRIGMAIHHETDGEGFQLWDKWSSEGKKYPGKDTLIGHWKSFENKPNGVTIGTLIFYAKENGYDVNLKENIPSKYVAKNSFDILDSYAMTDKKCAELKNTKYIIDGLIVEKYHTYISGPAGGGKTTVFLHMGFEMAEKDYTVYFIYLDGALSMAAEVHEEIKRRALNARYKLLIDATIEDCKKVMKEFIVNKADLSKTVFILDTFKYLTKDINNKRFNQEAMHFIKGLRNLGATFISLGHTNKNGENHSGTAEIEQDSDALLRIDATRDANEVICTIQRGGRCRCDIQEKSFKFTAGDVMSVEEIENPLELQEKKKIIAQEAKDRESIDEVIQILIDNPNILQKDLVAEVMDNLGTSKNKVQTLLDTYNNRYWTRSKSKEASNGYCYSVNDS